MTASMQIGQLAATMESGVTAGQIERLKELDWLDSHGNVVLAGPPGLGKTMIALGLGLLAVDGGYTVAFEKMGSFIEILDVELQIVSAV